MFLVDLSNIPRVKWVIMLSALCVFNLQLSLSNVSSLDLDWTQPHPDLGLPAINLFHSLNQQRHMRFSVMSSLV